MLTPFERRESSSSIMNENCLFVSKEWLFVDLGEQELEVVVIMIEEIIVQTELETV